MKLVLIFPGYKEFSRLDKSWVLHGIAHLYTEVKHRGHDVEFIDGRGKSFEIIKEKLEDKKITHIGLSVISAYKDNAKQLLKWLKSERNDIITIAGGIHATVCEKDFIENNDYLANYIVKGEGEIVLPEILEGKHKPGIIEGRVESLDTLLPVDRSIFNEDEELIGSNLSKPFATIMNSRACPSKCTFCAPVGHTMFGKKFKIRSVDHVINEIKSLNLKSFYMNDDNFIANPNYVYEFCDAIEKLNLTWWCQGRADIICNHEDMVAKMHRAGCTGMIIGHESGNNDILKLLNKGCTVEQNINSAQICNDHNIAVWSNIMLGLPDELPSQTMDTFFMMALMRPQIVSIATFTPHPGSYLYNECQKRKIMPDNPPQEYFNRGEMQKKIEGIDYIFLRQISNQIMNVVYNNNKRINL